MAIFPWKGGGGGDSSVNLYVKCGSWTMKNVTVF